MGKTDAVPARITEPATSTVLEVINRRRSIRAFSRQPLSQQTIENLLGAGRHAPTCWGRQSCEFIIVEDRRILETVSRNIRRFNRTLLKWRPLLRWFIPALREPELDALCIRLRSGELDPSQDTLFHDSPCVIFCCARRNELHGLQDCHLAAENILLAATDLGFGSLYSGSALAINYLPKSRRLIGLPSTHRVHCVCIIGYASEVPESRPLRKHNILNWIRQP